MNYLLKVLCVISITSIISGCEDKYSYSYLIEHPFFLKQEFDRCQAMDSKAGDQQKHCDVVMQAASKLSTVMDEMQVDPENFGVKIMQAQDSLAKIQEQLQISKQTLADLKEKNAAQADIQLAQNNVNKFQKECELKHQDVKMMLAIIGLRSPE